MMTPLDIQNKTFSKSAMGYNKEEVHMFLEELLKEYEALYKNYNEANARIRELFKENESLKSIEETMKNALVVAQSSAEQLKANAQKDAEAIIGEANAKSQDIIRKANEQLDKCKTQYDELRREISMFIMHTKSDFEIQIKALDKSLEGLEKAEV